MPAFKETKYTKMLNQHTDVIFTSPVDVKDEIEIYSFEFNGVKRYYAKINDILVKYFGLSGNGDVKSKYSNGKIFFPQMIRAKKKGFNRYHNFYIELTEEAFKISGYHTLMANTTVAKYLMEGINKMSNANIINETSEKPVVDNDSKEMITESVQTVEEEIAITGQLPLNYDELIESLHLRDNYGKMSVDIENDIKTIFTNAQFKVKIPIRIVEKEPEILNSIASIFTESLKGLCTVYNQMYPNMFNAKKEQQENTQCNVEAVTQPENINNFVNAMENAIIDKITRTYKNVPGGFIVERCKQLAYNLTLNEHADNHNSMWTLDNAQQTELYYLNIMLALFFINLIYHRNADYDVPKDATMHLPEPSYIDNKKNYIAFISLDNMYQGFISRKDYGAIILNNISKLIPNINVQLIKREDYMKIALALQNILKNAGFQYVRVITER